MNEKDKVIGEIVAAVLSIDKIEIVEVRKPREYAQISGYEIRAYFGLGEKILHYLLPEIEIDMAMAGINFADVIKEKFENDLKLFFMKGLKND